MRIWKLLWWGGGALLLGAAYAGLVEGWLTRTQWLALALASVTPLLCLLLAVLLGRRARA